MKTLKFMLAAATAIGLASAYAEPEAGASTTFESLAVDTPVVTGLTDAGGSSGLSYFYYAGENAEDNESVIVSGSPAFTPRPRGATGERSKILQVSTGTDPLLRAFTSFSSGEPISSTFTSDVYVDTLVQFTVTPYTDTVTPGDDDKLMIYLKEYTNEVGVVEGTNLVVIGGFCVADGEFEAKEYTIPGLEIEPNTWHRLTVKAIANYGALDGYKHPAFQVFFDGDENPCVFDSLAAAEGETTTGLVAPFNEGSFDELGAGTVVFSLKCTGEDVAPTLQAVGFAGEGKVDDLMITTLDPFVTALDFTLTWPSGLSAVEYTITNTTFSLSGETSPATIKVPVDYPAVTFTVANADGVQKTLNATASGETTGIDATGTEFFWSDYLGEAVSGAYEIDNTAEFILFQKGVAAGLATAGEVFKQTADVDLTDVDGFTGVGVTNTDSASGGTPFAGTYDGQGHKIANVKFSWRKYAGIFNQVNGATIQNLTGENLGFSETGSGEHGCAMVGNGVATLVALKSQYTGGFSVTNTHNAGGIMVRAMGGTTFTSCTNTADLVCCRDKMGGICCFMAPAENTTVAFVNCVNTGNYTLVTPPEGSKYNPGSNGFAGILGYTQGSGDVTMQGCENTGAFVNNLDTAQFSNDVYSGEFIGKVTSSGDVTDLGGNKFVAANKAIGYGDSKSTFLYATVDNGVGTTVTTLAKDTEYLLLKDVAASETPVFTLQAAGDTIAFDTALGYTFAGTVDSAAALGVSSATANTVTTYTAFTAVAQITGGAKYATLKDAVDAADTGDTVTTLANCVVDNGNTGITFTKGINLVNNYTITIDGANYALRIANGTTTPVTMSGTGSLVWANGSGSPILVGCNEIKSSYGINAFCEGSFVLNGGTLTSTYKTAKGGNLVKLEAGTFVLNDGTINGGTRGVKADSEGNNATCVLTINGGTIVNTNSAAIAASTAGSGSSTVVVNGGTFTGAITGTGMVTIPSTSTARFDRDQTAYCVADYKTVLSDGWYVVTPMVYYTAISLNKATTSIETNTTETLTATLTPASAADDTVTWTTSDPTVATVEGGVVTAVAAGTATITAATKNYSATCTVTVTATAPAAEGWDEDPTQIQEGKTAAQEYPALAESALASADAKKLTVWAKANSVNFADAGAAAADSTLVEAFMLNCAATAEAVAAAEANFKATITVNADGTITVTAPEGYNVTPQMKGSNNLSTWTDVEGASSSYKFYKFELSL